MVDEITINDVNELNELISKNDSVAAYFSTPDCNICKALKPKLKELLSLDFPEIKYVYVDLSRGKELSAQNSVFAVPTILFYFDGKELIRKSRNINLYQLKEELKRPYSFLFNKEYK